MIRRLLAALLVTFAVVATASPAFAGEILDRAAAALRKDSVYVDPRADLPLSSAEVDKLRADIRAGNEAIFIAVLPKAAIDEVGGNPNDVPLQLFKATGLSGTYAVLAGNSFRAGSENVSGATGMASAAFQAHRSEGPAAVLDDFVKRVQKQSDKDLGLDGKDTSTGETVLGWAFLIGIAVVIVLVVRWRRIRRNKGNAEQHREFLRPELQVLADDVMALDPQVAIHEAARDDYDAGVSRYRWAEAALPKARSRADFERVARALAEGRYAMARARAVIDGHEPPPPPPELQAPSPANDPPVVLVDNRPAYAGYGGGWYGGGWFGGNELFTGILLGEMLGGGGRGFGGWWSGGGWTHGGGWSTAGSGGDVGGGDFGGGDWGGGGGDFGGGDWGGGGGDF